MPRGRRIFVDGRMASGDLEFNLGDENVMGRKLKRTVHDWSSSFYTLASHPRQHCIFGMGKRAGGGAVRGIVKQGIKRLE